MAGRRSCDATSMAAGSGLVCVLPARPCKAAAAVDSPLARDDSPMPAPQSSGAPLPRSAAMQEMDKEQVVGVLNRLLEAELAGVVRYTHYSLLVFGFGRIPIVSWLRDQAT